MTHEIIPVQYISDYEYALVFVEKSSISQNVFKKMDLEIDSIIREIEWKNEKC